MTQYGAYCFPPYCVLRTEAIPVSTDTASIHSFVSVLGHAIVTSLQVVGDNSQDGNERHRPDVREVHGCLRQVKH